MYRAWIFYINPQKNFIVYSIVSRSTFYARKVTIVRELDATVVPGRVAYSPQHINPIRFLHIPKLATRNNCDATTDASPPIKV